MNTTAHDPRRLIRLPALMALTGLSRSSVYRLAQDPGLAADAFPRSVKIGRRAVAWRESEVLAWLASRQPAVAPADA